MSEWKKYVMNDLANIIDCEHKTAPKVDFSNYYSIRTSNISNGKIDYHNANRITKNTFQEWTKRGVPKEGDIILAREAPVGEVGLVKKGFNTCLGQRTVLIQLESNEVHNLFLLYYLVNPLIKHELKVRSKGSVVAHLNMKDIRAFQVSLPSLSEQKAIASVLSSLDDKIDLLQRQNKTLEAMAETLFREWFVEGAQEDWEEGVLGDISINVKDGIKVIDIDPTFKYVALEHIDKKQIGLSGFEYATNVGSNKYRFKKGDILYGKLRPYFHKVCFASFSGICSTDILVIRPKNKDLLYFCLFAFFQKEVVDFSNAGTTGTRMPRTNWKILSSYELKIPDRKAIAKFNDVVMPCIEKINKNLSQIRTLENLRDTLLPKLMNGKIRIPTDG